MKKLLALLLICLLFCACASKEVPKVSDSSLTKEFSPTTETPTEPPVDAFKLAQANFAVNLLKANFQNDNVLISPLSVNSALAMTLNGADNETKSQMEAVLGLPLDELNTEILKYTTALNSNELATLNIANSIWVKNGDFKVNNDFLQAIVNYYNADVFKEDFNSETLEKINNWVSQNTNEMIKNILDRIDSSAIMYLINALAFEAEWLDPYYDHNVSESEFTSINSKKQKVEMMYSTETVYLEDDSATGFMKRYSGNYAFVALLPKDDIESYVKSLDGNKIISIIGNKTYSTVECKLPKFSLDYSVTLNDSLINMGMPDAFNPKKADFSKISDVPLYINRVIHKTHITVNELGTKAGAATAVEINCEGAVVTDDLKKVYLDRPFLYMIIDTTSNLPIFMGVLSEIQ